MSRFINMERGQKIKSFRIDRMEALSALAGRPDRCAPCIHIAGSKGKGSVTAMITGILEASGKRTARYMSPHVSNIRERLCLGANFFDEEVYVSAGDELRGIVENCRKSNPLFASDEDLPTYFEIMTLFFFLCARRSRCDAMVVETGMGGRLDATNIIDPLVSVITIIELEHTAFLGGTIEAIAGEKAGIIKQGKPLVLAGQRDAALRVFRERARDRQCKLVYFPETAEIKNISTTTEGTEFELGFTAQNSPLKLFIPVPGKVQAENAALSVIATLSAFPQTGHDALRRGLAGFSLPARFERISQTPPVIIDGAHTPESLSLCIETFVSLYGEGGVLVFGCAIDKDVNSMAKIASPHFSKIFITTPGTFKQSDPAAVYKAFAAEKTCLVENTSEAVGRALEFARQNNLPMLGTGSFYLAAEICSIK
jgi:dihydrofolate synthase/folylpolyglutamate synthase